MRSDLAIQLDTPQRRVSKIEEHRKLFDEIAAKCVARSNKRDVRYFGDKTPEHSTRINTLRRTYPNCPIIFIYRDPRDVVVSLREVPWISCSVRSAASIWKRYAKALMQYLPAALIGGGRRFLPVCYEDLVCRREATIREICSFLELGYEPDVANGLGDSSVVPDRELAWKSRSLGRIESDRVGRWKAVLTAHEVGQIERIAGNPMQQFGYQRETTEATLRYTDWAPMAFGLARTFTSLTYQCILSEAIATVENWSHRRPIDAACSGSTPANAVTVRVDGNHTPGAPTADSTGPITERSRT